MTECEINLKCLSKKMGEKEETNDESKREELEKSQRYTLCCVTVTVKVFLRNKWFRAFYVEQGMYSLFTFEA